MNVIEKMARAMADMNGDDYDLIPAHKGEWIRVRGEVDGRPRDINEPFKSDYDDMARAALAAVMKEAELTGSREVVNWIRGALDD